MGHFFVTRPEVKYCFRDPTRPDPRSSIVFATRPDPRSSIVFATRPDPRSSIVFETRPDPTSKIFFGKLKRVFSDIKHFFDESIRTLEIEKNEIIISSRIAALSYVKFEICPFIMTRPDPTRPELENYLVTRSEVRYRFRDPIRPDPSRSLSYTGEKVCSFTLIFVP